MGKITKLTDAQIARFDEFREKWIAIGLSTEPADRQRAEAAIAEMYRQGGLAPPRKIVWCGSPLSQGLTRAILLDDAFAKSVRQIVGHNVKQNVRQNVRQSVRQNVRQSVGQGVWQGVGQGVWQGVGQSVGQGVWQSVWQGVGQSVGQGVCQSVWQSVYGSHDASWLSFYEYFRSVVGMDDHTEILSGIFELAKSAGWALPHKHICWVSERHSLLALDDRGRLHSVSGPAVMYPDGWKIYAVHGVRVPGDIIEQPKSITIKRIDDERNAEVRRVMIDQYGTDRYMQDSGAEEIAQDKWGKLYLKTVANDEDIVMVRVTNSTPEKDGSSKKYWLRVDPQLRPIHPDGTLGDPQEMTPHNAIASTFGMRGSEYCPDVET